MIGRLLLAWAVLTLTGAAVWLAGGWGLLTVGLLSLPLAVLPDWDRLDQTKGD